MRACVSVSMHASPNLHVSAAILPSVVHHHPYDVNDLSTKYSDLRIKTMHHGPQ